MAIKDKTVKVTEEFTSDGHLAKTTKEHQPGKIWFDWVQLLIMPFLIFFLGIGFTWVQNQTSIQIAKDNRTQDLQIAADQQQEATLKSYLDDMSDLLFNHNLHNSKTGDEVRQVARTRTLTTLRRLNANRNRIVFHFLHDAHLIGIDSSGIDLRRADLSGDDLSGADLSDADLSYDKLVNANLTNADLTRTTLTGADLSDTNLKDAYIRGADLSETNLSHAILVNAYLHAAVLNWADLSQADLKDADLSSCDLNHAMVTKEQLAETKSLRDTTMPDGSTHP